MATPAAKKPAGRRGRTPSRTPRGRRPTPGALDRVAGGRITKHESPRPSHADSSYLEEGSSRLDDVEREMEADRYEEMMEEKKLFPGSEEWSPDEERLFQLLFMRQYIPLMPPHWSVDFRGIPLPKILFATSEVDRAVIYSQSERDFRATKAIIRLIDLTASVRAFVQTNQKAKIPGYMKKELDQYVRWAALDGHYEHPHELPNLIVEVVDMSIGGAGITDYIQARLRGLAEQHRTFWRETPERPPVLYGLFIVNTTLLVLTVDPSKGEEAHVSYQVEVNFNQRNQGVWNAITVAIVVCLARDDMITRKQYFGK
ncbi:uncharacterized protein DNG_01191 [Cephalotrichum gorgonifer]|uniref:Uncharacterized protein n=1 Tax=Cephalotrichum gorgonifer TaxID=2041049 RepID=A0AAE8SRY4_9PEZI|nr:uncharacterized protein DNG_01191 [Cephalotrichum gorgonifer]